MLLVTLLCGLFWGPKGLETVASPEVNHRIMRDRGAWVVFAMDKSDQVKYKIAEEVSQELKDVCRFLVYDSDSAAKATEFTGREGPSFYFFNASLFVASFSVTDDKDALKRVILQICAKEPNPVSTSFELSRTLELSSFSVVVAPENYRHGRFLFFDLCKTVNDVQLLCVDDELITGAGLSTSNVGLYRRDDRAFVSFTEDNMSTVAVPRVRMLTFDGMIGEDDTIVAVNDRDGSPEMRERMIELAAKFPRFVFGFVSGDLVAEAEAMFPGLMKCSGFYVFSLKRRYWVDTSDVEGFGDVEKVLSDIMTGKRHVSYISEEGVAEMTAENVKLVTGVTYGEFVAEDSDVIMLFSKASDPCEFRAVYEDRAREWAKFGVRMGIIDVEKNSEDFPWIPDTPYVVLFPKRNKTDTQPLRGKLTGNNMGLLLRDYGSDDTRAIKAEVPSRDEFQEDVMQLSSLIPSMPAEDRRKHFQWMFKMSSLVEGHNKEQEL